MLHPAQDIHGIEIDVEDLQTMKIDQGLGDLYTCSEVPHHLGRHPLCVDRGGQRNLVEQRGCQVDTPIRQPSVFDDDRKIRRGWQFAVNRGETGDLVVEIALVDEPGLGRQFDEGVRAGPLVASDQEVMSGVLAMAAAVCRKRMNACELIKGRGLAIDV